MMADYPAAYRGQPGLEFLTRVPTTWDETRVLHAEMGQCLVIARRRGNAWYLGGMTSTHERQLAMPLEFLGDGGFEAELYLDHPPGGPNAITRSKQAVSATDTLRVVIPRAGGFAAVLTRTAG